MRGTAKDTLRSLQPVIVGADILAYSYVRCFHEAYGVQSIVLASQNQKYMSTSRFCEYRVVPGIDRESVLLPYLVTLGRQLAQERKIPLLLGVGDWYVRLISQNKAQLSPWFTVPYIDFPLLDRITQKDEFYHICERLNIPYPRTWEVDCSDPDATVDARSFTYPLIAKPSNSALYHYVQFEGQEKVFTIETPEKLTWLVETLKRSSYDKALLIQEYIPGDDARLRSITCFCDAEGNVSVSCMGKVVLQDHDPTAIGNPVCIIDDYDQEVLDQAARFLNEVGYEGYANFDAKFDERDGTYKFFEINTRPGRNTYYVTLAGENFVKPIVEHYVLGHDAEPTLANHRFAYRVIPTMVIRRYADPSSWQQVRQRLHDHRDGCPLFYRKDTLAHNFWSLLTYLHQIIKFHRYVGSRPRQ